MEQLIAELEQQLKAAHSSHGHNAVLLFYMGGASALMWLSSIFGTLPFSDTQSFPAVVAVACIIGGFHFRSIDNSRIAHERRIEALAERAGIERLL
jgi:hypothetical protein